MVLHVLTAVTGAAWETELVAALDGTDHGVAIARRCVDVGDLLAAAATGIGQAALLSADLRRLDVETVTRLEAAGLAVVGLVESGDEQGTERLLRLGVTRVLPASSDATTIAQALHEAVAGDEASRPPFRHDIADPRSALPSPDRGPLRAQPAPGAGRVVAVWGPTGAPGRTTVAVGVVDEAARLGVDTLLVDGDVYGGVVAQVLGLLDESPGLAGAARQAGTGTLDADALVALAWAVRPHLRVLTGLARADRWPELRPRAVAVVLEEARRLAALTVVDCSFCIEEDEELSFDAAAPRRNGVTLTVLEAADTVLCVSGADPVSLQRTIRALDQLREVLPEVEPTVVVNQLRTGPVPGDARQQIAGVLNRFTGRTVEAFLPADRRASDAALAAGRTLAEVASGSALRVALRTLAAQLAGASERAAGSRRGGRRRHAG